MIVDLGLRGHRGPWVLGHGLLLNGNRGRKAGDEIHIRFVHALEELPGIGAQAFYIAALPFCIDRVEGER